MTAVLTGLLAMIVPLMFFPWSRKRQLSIRIIAEVMPQGEGVYITGNDPLLGSWQPRSVALVRQGDGSWRGDFSFRRNTVLEFKITRGDWASEAVDAAGKNLMNCRYQVRDDGILRLHVHNWRDLLKPDASVAAVKPQDRITGTVRFHRGLSFPGLAGRDIIVWLPPGYEDHLQRRYPVLYMHDGQNVFDPYTSYTGVAWKADTTATRLIAEKRLQEIIIVGVYNCASIDRLQEYSLSHKGRDYMRFLVEELKPLIDREYRTLPEALHTAVAGSSMGGLISFLLLWQYPQVFGKAACLSPSFIWDRSEAIRWLKQKTPPAGIRLYMDCGGIGGEKLLYRGCKQVLRQLKRQGFSVGKDFQFSYDPLADHSEGAWGARFWKPLEFLFPAD